MYFREWLWHNPHDRHTTVNQERDRCQNERTNTLCAAALGVDVGLSVLLLRNISRVPGRNRCHINIDKRILFYQSSNADWFSDDVYWFSDDACEPQHYNRGAQTIVHLLVWWITKLHNFGRTLSKALLEKELNSGCYRADINRCG